MSDIDDVVRTVSAENGIITLEVDSRYLCGTHPDQEAIEAKSHQQLMDNLHEVGKRTAERLEQEILKAIIMGGESSYRVCPSVMTASAELPSTNTP